MVDNISLTNLSSLTNETTAISQINNNSAAITTMSDNVLFTSGGNGIGQTMQVALDMNSNHIINLPAPLGPTEPLRVEDAASLTAGGTITVNNVPSGGTTGQPLRKTSATNYAVDWTTPLVLGTPTSATLTNATGLPLTTGVTGTLPAANGGTGVTTSTGTGSVVLSTSPTLTSPSLDTPSAITLTNATGLPLTTGVTGVLPAANGGTGISTVVPYFYGYLSTNQSVTTATATKIQITSLLDNKTWFSGASNYRYTPLLAGTYQVSMVVTGGATNPQLVQALLYKNGSLYSYSLWAGNNTQASTSGTWLIAMNGSTDYIEAWGEVTASTTPLIVGASNQPTTISIRYIGP
jgi:hypothetical protein